MRIHLPTVNYWNDWAPDQMVDCFTNLWGFEVPAAVLDFSRCTFLSVEGAAVLVALKLERDRLGHRTLIDWPTLSNAVHKQLGRWGISALFGADNHPWTDNAIPLLHQARTNSQEVVDYFDRAVVRSGNMPAMTPELERRTLASLCEIFGNIFRHAESGIGGFAIGQMHPRRQEFQICVCDVGVGLVSRVQGAGFGRESAAAAVEWALAAGNSTDYSAPSGLEARPRKGVFDEWSTRRALGHQENRGVSERGVERGGGHENEQRGCQQPGMAAR